jgi:hypothetical protein
MKGNGRGCADASLLPVVAAVYGAFSQDLKNKTGYRLRGFLHGFGTYHRIRTSTLWASVENPEEFLVDFCSDVL